MNKNNIFTISKKEFLGYINSATAYILTVPFILITFFLYFRQAFVTNQASLRPFFDILPYILLFIAPAIAMRTFAQEQKNKTLEVLFSHPISELEIVLGKFLGSLAFFASMLAATVTLPITAVAFSNPDLGVIVSQYLGALFVGGAFIAIGLATASLMESQVASFLSAAAISFALILIGTDLVLLGLPSTLGAFVSQLAILPHASNISRGALDLRDLLYFITLIGLTLTIAVIKLSSRKIAENPSSRQKMSLALGVILALGIITNVLMYSYPIRIDLTGNRQFTLSNGTKTTLANLPDLVTISLFTSSNLPGTVETSVRQTRDLLRDYQRLGKGKIKLLEKHPDRNPQDKALATQEGIQEVQFNTLSDNAFAVQAGFVGISMQYLDKKETIPFIQNASDLEYQLTRLIRKMTVNKIPELALYTQPNVSYSGQTSAINALRQTLKDQYAINDLDLSQSEASITGNALLVYGLTNSLGATASAKIKSFITGGGNTLLLLDNHTVNPQMGTAPSYNLGIEDLLASDFGITVNQDLVYDLRLNEIITLQSGNQQYLLPYPFWLKALPAKTKKIALGNIGSVTMAWPNSFSLISKEGVSHEIILTTSKNGGAQTGSFQISPDMMKPEEFKADGQEKPLAVMAENANSKVIVVGDSDFLTDQFVQNANANLNFASILIDQVAADDVMATVNQKSADNPVFVFGSASQAETIQWLNILGAPLAVAAIGVWWLWKRKKMYKRVYNV